MKKQNEITKEVEDKGYKLFTLGVGTERGSQISTGKGYKTDKQGNTVVSKLNSGSLKLLASKTDGEYFEINESRNDVNKLINTISKIEGQMRDARVVDASANPCLGQKQRVAHHILHRIGERPEVLMTGPYPGDRLHVIHCGEYGGFTISLSSVPLGRRAWFGGPGGAGDAIGLT